MDEITLRDIAAQREALIRKREAIEQEIGISEPFTARKYVVFGPGMSGDTDDIDRARLWLQNNPEAALYVRLKQMNNDKEWLLKKAEQEDGCFVSVGCDCLSQPRGLGCAPVDGRAVHLHRDGTWWFWTTWTNEEGPYATELLADDACKRYVETL